MDFNFDPRAEVAMRSLTGADQRQVKRTLLRIKKADPSNWHSVMQTQQLDVMGGETLYFIKASDNFDILTRITSGNLIVQDIFPRERLQKITR